jgi:hypothetical protein
MALLRDGCAEAQDDRPRPDGRRLRCRGEEDAMHPSTVSLGRRAAIAALGASALARPALAQPAAASRVLR